MDVVTAFATRVKTQRTGKTKNASALFVRQQARVQIN